MLTFQNSWLEQYKWLVYSPSEQGGFCKYCALFPPTTSQIKTGVLVSIPMKKFNKATGKCGYLVMHEHLEYHQDAVVRNVSLRENLEHPESSLSYKISSLNKKLYDNNFCILLLSNGGLGWTFPMVHAAHCALRLPWIHLAIMLLPAKGMVMWFPATTNCVISLRSPAGELIWVSR